jgi:uncharacterized cupredoxin-like copper-binding protein
VATLGGVSMTRNPMLAVALILMALPACRQAEAKPEGDGRTVDVTIHFSHFEPDRVVVRPGETVTFVVRNTDPIDHEFILGDEQVQQIHEEGTEPIHAPKSGEMTVPAGTNQVTTYTFPARDGQLIFGCHLPGHYAYGMRGLVSIAG